jgi:hypothetical protein
MKFICLGYFDEKRWATLPEGERQALMDACFAYDDVLRQYGHFAGGEALESATDAATLRYRKDKVVVTDGPDGPFAETKEQLGGLLILEATDRKQAIELMSKHPGLRVGPFEIRAVEDMTPIIRESEARRPSTAAAAAATAG